MTAQRVIALLGRRDAPTDAVEAYSRYLGTALQKHNFQVEIRRIPWDTRGWANALAALRLMATTWRGSWVLVQYTALAWSTRGFPGKLLHVLYALIKAGARVAIVYHDVEPFPGSRFVDRFRRLVQLRTMRSALRLAEVAVFTVPLERISWLENSPASAHFITVGPNLPITDPPVTARSASEFPTVGVFSVTGGEPGVAETRAIIAAIRHSARQIGKLRLSVFGRNADSAEATLREALRDLPVEISVEGLLDEPQLVERLSGADVLLFVRGHISSRRGSAIAGIACGLPVIAFAGAETAAPISDAGVILVSHDNQDELNAALFRVLSDSSLYAELAARSRAAFVQHFAWHAIAARYATILK